MSRDSSKEISVQKIRGNDHLVLVPKEIKVIDPSRAGIVVNLIKDGNEFILVYFNSEGVLSMDTFPNPPVPQPAQGQPIPRRYFLFGTLPTE